MGIDGSPSRDEAIETARAMVAEMRALRQDLAVVSAQLAALAGAAQPGGPIVSEKFQSVFADLLAEAAGVGKGRRRARR